LDGSGQHLPTESLRLRQPDRLPAAARRGLFPVREDRRGRSGRRERGIGRRLAEAIIEEARAAGYRRMCLDTVPSMQAAMSIYESLGFKDGEPYVFNPVPGARFMEMVLKS